MEWIAHYRDGTSLRQHNPDGTENLFKDINESQLVLFELESDTHKKYQVQIKPGRKLVFFRRHFAKMGEPEDIHHFLGWQENYYNHTITRLLEIKPNGDVEIHDNR